MQAAGMVSMKGRERHTLACRSGYHRGRAQTSWGQEACRSPSSAVTRHEPLDTHIAGSPHDSGK